MHNLHDIGSRHSQKIFISNKQHGKLGLKGTKFRITDQHMNATSRKPWKKNFKTLASLALLIVFAPSC